MAAKSQFDRDGYLRVRRLLRAPLLEFIQIYVRVLFSAGRFTRDPQCPGSLAIYGDPGFDTLLESARLKIGNRVGRDLVPTYSYVRMYGKGDALPRHKDRAACEISATIALSVPPRAPPSTLQLEALRGRDVLVEMREGDACLYAGTRIDHWRAS